MSTERPVVHLGVIDQRGGNTSNHCSGSGRIILSRLRKTQDVNKQQ